MTNPENARLLTEERALQEAEAALGRQEQALWQRMTALDSGLEAPAQAVLGRIAALEAAGAGSADLTRASGVLTAMTAAEAPLAVAERTSALAARRGAGQTRDTSFKALSAGVTQYETARQAKKKELDAVESFVVNMEKMLQQAIEKRRAAQTGATAAAAPPPNGPKVS